MMGKWREQLFKQDALHIFIYLLSFVAFNLVAIDLLIISALISGPGEDVLGVKTKVVSKKSKVTPTPTQIPYCPVSCLTEIKKAVTATSTTQTIAPTTATKKIKDHYIFLGTGSTTSAAWVSVPGARVNLNISDYDNVQKAVFETAVTNPYAGQRVYIRLYNLTTDEVVTGSTVTFDGNSSGLLTSGAISLPSGEQAYQVQMYAVLDAQANLTLSRIHITTN